jgi:hypothetical protein
MQLKDITFKNVIAFIQGYTRKWAIAFFENMLRHINEQVEWRIDRVAERSPECLLNGECKICHCKTPELFYADKPCSNPEIQCYPALMSKKEWIQYKNKHVSTSKTTGNGEQPEEQNNQQDPDTRSGDSIGEYGLEQNNS